MALRDFGTDEALEKYEKEKGAAEKSGEGWAADRTEFEAVQKEKKLRKPGAVSRFFNQFGIGKYWERMNDYFEQEEKMEKSAAEKAAVKETVGDVKTAAGEKVQEVKGVGAEMPVKIEAAAARAGAEAPEAAPVVAEAKVEEAAIEEEAEAAKADLIKELPPVEEFEEIARGHEAMAKKEKEEAEDVEIVEKESMEDEVRKKYKDTPVNEIDARIKSLNFSIGKERDYDARELLEAERDILAKVKKEKMPAKAREKKIEVKLPAWDEEENLENLPPVEEFEAVAKEHEEQAVPSPEKVKAAEVLEEEVEEPKAELPSTEEFEEIARAHETNKEMAKAKIEAVPLDKKKQKEELEDILIDFGFRRGDKVPVIDESGKVDPSWEIIGIDKDKGTAFVTKKGKDKEPMLKTIDLEELKQWKREEEFFGKGKKESRKRMWRGVKSLAGARGEYAAQRKKKAEKAFKISEPEVKPEIKKKPKPKRIKLKVA